MEGIAELDRHITLAINSLSHPASDAVWKLFSNIPVWIPLYVLVIVFFFVRFEWKKALVATLACILAFAICDQFSGFIKDLVCRHRPCWDEWMIENGLNILEKKGGQYGFFSGHAANAMGFATCSFLAMRSDGKTKASTYGWLIYIWALLVGFSRIFVGKHFLGDVMVGFIAGIAIGAAMGYLSRFIMLRLSRR